MDSKKKENIRKLFGSYLKKEGRISKNRKCKTIIVYFQFRPSKLTKIEKGLIDIRFDTLMEVALTYKLTQNNYLIFRLTLKDEEE